MTDKQVTGPKGAVLKGYVSTPDASNKNPSVAHQVNPAPAGEKYDPEARPNTPKNKNAVH